MSYPRSFEELKENFEKLPGIGEKSAERFVFSILKMDDDEIEEFSENLSKIKKKIKHCNICVT
jgi:recombination protein RecR